MSGSAIPGSDISTLPSRRKQGPILSPPSKMGPWQCALPALETSNPEIVFFAASARCGLSPRRPARAVPKGGAVSRFPEIL